MQVEKTEGALRTREDVFTYHNAECFQINIPEKLGSAQGIYYNVETLEEYRWIINELKIKNSVVYIMTCRIESFMKYFYNDIQKLGGRVSLNLDGACGIICMRYNRDTA